MRATISGEVSTLSPARAPGVFLKAEKLLKPMNWPPRASKAEAVAVVSTRPVIANSAASLGSRLRGLQDVGATIFMDSPIIDRRELVQSWITRNQPVLST